MQRHFQLDMSTTSARQTSLGQHQLGLSTFKPQIILIALDKREQLNLD